MCCMAQEMDRLRSMISSKEGEISTLQEQVTKLEAVRDSLSEELVQAMQVGAPVALRGGGPAATALGPWPRAEKRLCPASGP